LTVSYAERVIGGYFLDITPDREALGRYGLMVGDVQDATFSISVRSVP
jgi:Cu(I)/Ag(I) efflux system membrane protein CusA/SilA